MSTINLFTLDGTLLKSISGTVGNHQASYLGAGLILSLSAAQIQTTEISTATVMAGVATAPHSPVALAMQRALNEGGKPIYDGNLAYILTEYTV